MCTPRTDRRPRQPKRRPPAVKGGVRSRPIDGRSCRPAALPKPYKVIGFGGGCLSMGSGRPSMGCDPEQKLLPSGQNKFRTLCVSCCLAGLACLTCFPNHPNARATFVFLICSPIAHSLLVLFICVPLFCPNSFPKPTLLFAFLIPLTPSGSHTGRHIHLLALTYVHAYIYT